MSLTLQDIMEKLKDLDEILLLEILGIDSEMIIERFSDLIEDNADKLEEELDDGCDE